MYVRLAFAVAAHLEPEILIVDEVLAVGDAAFQKKCLGKMGEVAREGRTVLFVSHNLAAVRSLCTRGIVLDRGGDAVRRRGGGGPRALPVERGRPWRAGRPGQLRGGGPGVRRARGAVGAPLQPGGGGAALSMRWRPITIDVEYQATARLRGARTVIGLVTSEGEVAFQSTNHQTRTPICRPGVTGRRARSRAPS